MSDRLSSQANSANTSGNAAARSLDAVMLLLITLPVALLAPVAQGGAEVFFLKAFTIVVLSFLPGWLYLRFIVFRAGALWEEYVLNLHRLGMDEPRYLPKPPLHSIYYEQWRQDVGDADAEPTHNIYRQKFEAYYGKEVAPGGGDNARFRSGTLFPVFLTTAVLALGWAAVLSGDALLADSRQLAVDVLRFGFLGAYLFILQMLIRRYFQSDLKPSAYISAVIRVFSVLILVMVLHQMWQDQFSPEAQRILAFVVGFFPLVGMQALQKAAAVALRVAVPTLRTNYPLSDLDGLNIWYEARLLEEGIEDMQNLATANLVDVILHTRVPVGRMIDWVDQALLYLHLAPSKRGFRRSKAEESRTILRRLGIRAATDLENAFKPSAHGEGTASLVAQKQNDELLEALRWVLNDDALPRWPSVTQALLKSFESDLNLDHVRHWKQTWRRTARAGACSAHALRSERRAQAASAGDQGNGAAEPFELVDQPARLAFAEAAALEEAVTETARGDPLVEHAPDGGDDAVPDDGRR